MASILGAAVPCYVLLWLFLHFTTKITKGAYLLPLFIIGIPIVGIFAQILSYFGHDGLKEAPSYFIGTILAAVAIYFRKIKPAQ